MPRNLKNIFRSELIRQRRNAKHFGGREKLKKIKNGKYADYSHIYSDRSYQTHLGRAKKFAAFCKENGVKKMNQITPALAEKFLFSERDRGLSASTIGEDALCINHLLIGSGHWRASDKLQKAKLPGMPKRSNLISKQREKNLNSEEWRRQCYPNEYQRYRPQIDTIRAFGLRRRELVGEKAHNFRDGLGTKSLYYFPDGSIRAVIQGKGGKIRWSVCRKDLQPTILHLFQNNINPYSTRPRQKYLRQDYMHNLRTNRPFFKPFSHSIPTHIFRADFAQNRLRELASQRFSGTYQYVYYRRLRRSERTTNGPKYAKEIRRRNLNTKKTIGEFTAPLGSFLELCRELGHNRLSILSCYIGLAR